MAVGISEVEIIKPRTDKREYRRIILSNSLEVLLISDPDTDKVYPLLSTIFFFFSCDLGDFLHEGF